VNVPRALIAIGAVAFIAVLFVSAVWQADIRWLHFFQAWMYVAALALAWRGRKVGLFIGISAAGLWDYANLVATSFLRNGIEEVAKWIDTGRLQRPDQLIAVFAWLSNFLVVAGCVWAYARRSDKRLADLGWFLVVFVLTTGFFAAAMALFQPRYLALFPAMLHPRAQW
jgi:hypothetical protein